MEWKGSARDQCDNVPYVFNSHMPLHNLRLVRELSLDNTLHTQD